MVVVLNVRQRDVTYLTGTDKLVYPIRWWMGSNSEFDSEVELVLNDLHRRDIPRIFTVRWADLGRKERVWRFLGRTVTAASNAFTLQCVIAACKHILQHTLRCVPSHVHPIPWSDSFSPSLHVHLMKMHPKKTGNIIIRSDKFCWLFDIAITAYCIWSVISANLNLNRESSSLGLVCHVPLKRDQWDWDWRLRLHDAPNATDCTEWRIPIGCLIFFWSFPAKMPYN